jgi:multicomponent Na+:H+ antiporter subunit B
MSEAIIAALLLLLVMLAVIAVRAADLLTAVVVLGAYGFTMSLVWAGIGAVDVAFTEAAVGAGASTVLFLAALLRTSRRRSALPSRLRWVALGIVLAVGAALVAVTRPLAPWGDPDSPASRHVSPRYITQTVAETGTPNAVTSVLADYRGYDTLIETVVIFSSGVGGWLLLRRRQP